jgi:hypothetical protein
MSQFAAGYAIFTHVFLLSIVIGVAAFFVRAVKEVNAENKAKSNEHAKAVLTKLSKKIADLSVTYNEKYDTYYVFNTENNQFVMQDTNPLHLLQNIRDTFLIYDLHPENEATAAKMVAEATKLMANEV